MRNAEQVRSQLIAVALMIALAALLAAFLWWDQQRTGSRGATSAAVESATAGAAPSTIAEPAAQPFQEAPRSPSHTKGLYRCDGPSGTTYQAAPCNSEMRQVEFAGGTFSVVDAGARYYRPVVDSRPRSSSAVGLIEHGAREGDRNEVACARHEKAIRQIDSAARQGQSSQGQEWLRMRRKEHKDEMWRLRCGF